MHVVIPPEGALLNSLVGLSFSLLGFMPRRCGDEVLRCGNDLVAACQILL